MTSSTRRRPGPRCPAGWPCCAPNGRSRCTASTATARCSPARSPRPGGSAVPNNVKYVNVAPPKTAQGTIRAVYDQARKEIGMLPDAVVMFSPSESIGTTSWGLFRETLLSSGPAPRLVKEALAAQVSKLNECPFCVDAHTIMLYGGGAGTFATSLLSGAPELAGDPELTAVAGWAEAVMTRPAGQVAAPFPAEQVPDV